jgi:hypothetical protein
VTTEKTKESHLTETKEKKDERKEKVPSHSDPVAKYVGSVDGTLKAVALDEKYEPVKETPVGEITDALSSLEGVHTLVFDGVITQRLVDLASEKGISLVVGARRGNITKQPVNMTVKTFREVKR